MLLKLTACGPSPHSPAPGSVLSINQFGVCFRLSGRFVHDSQNSPGEPLQLPLEIAKEEERHTHAFDVVTAPPSAPWEGTRVDLGVVSVPTHHHDSINRGQPLVVWPCCPPGAVSLGQRAALKHKTTVGKTVAGTFSRHPVWWRRRQAAAVKSETPCSLPSRGQCRLLASSSDAAWAGCRHSPWPLQRLPVPDVFTIVFVWTGPALQERSCHQLLEILAHPLGMVASGGRSASSSPAKTILKALLSESCTVKTIGSLSAVFSEYKTEFVLSTYTVRAAYLDLWLLTGDPADERDGGPEKPTELAPILPGQRWPDGLPLRPPCGLFPSCPLTWLDQREGVTWGGGASEQSLKWVPYRHT
ncbi:uncharacterized protein LOC115505703 isoform X1 [Lynx canadensis]|uniref:uncharacterized protein LOC115505703 isoform X1 n=1 Tax=Lynx canadensis TaxID=61383 RepID=UPI0011B0EADD|nr:uncharacterized protein LOC115505703 isoform X1 [Lynx canadensis]